MTGNGDPLAQHKREARLAALLDHSAEVTALCDRDGTLLFVSRGIEPLLGYAPDEMLGAKRTDFVLTQEHGRITPMFAALVASPAGTSGTIEVQVKRKDGATRWLESTATNLLDDPGVGAVMLHLRDVTERRRVRERLRDSSFFLEEAQELAKIGSFIADAGSGALVAWSPECARLLGLQKDAPAAATPVESFVFAADRALLRDAAQQAAPVGALDIEFRVVRADGALRWVHLRAVAEKAEPGLPRRIVGCLQDITEQRQATEALRAREQLFRRIVEGTSEGIWVTDKDAVTTFVNEPMAKMVGRTPDEMIAVSALEFLRPVDLPVVERSRARRQRGAKETVEVTLPHKDGGEIWAQVTSTPLFDAQGNYDGTLSLISNLTERRRAVESQAQLATIVASSRDAIVSVDLQGHITSWNPAATRLFGYPSTAMIGASIDVLLPERADEAGDGVRLLDRALGGEQLNDVEVKRRRDDGSLVPVSVSIVPLKDASGVIRGVSKTFRDLTAQRAAEEQLRHAQKMEAIGLFAGGIAHDFNNVLTVIHGYGSLLHQEVDDELRADTQEIVDAASRATALTNQLLAFSRRQVLQPKVIDASAVLNGIRRMLRRLVGEQIELVIAPGDDVGRIHVDQGQLEQVIVNLVVNAKDATPAGGRVTVSTCDAFAIDFTDAERAQLPPSRTTVLVVHDTGVGMDAETRARIFEPFFTTKERGHGTGLGLATVFGIVKQSGGHVMVRSRKGEGATFFVAFPSTEEALSVPAPTVHRAQRRGCETVLVVDDDDAVRGLVVTVLRRQGYTVLEAGNGGEAFLIAERTAKIDLLLCDVVMPRMGGREVAERLRTLQPRMRVLLMSGYFDDVIAVGDLPLLRKPASPEEITARVRDVLDQADTDCMATPLHVLFVDDDDLMLASMRRVLRSECLRMSFVSSAAAALALIKETHVDVVVTDHVMPDMTGAELIAELKKKHPSIACILTTANVVAPALDADVRLLQKPWDPQQLREAIADVRARL